jgi:hypothetical protein
LNDAVAVANLKRKKRNSAETGRFEHSSLR